MKIRPLFNINALTKITIKAEWQNKIDTFILAIKNVTGKTDKIYYWPYRADNREHVAVHVYGSAGEISMVFTICGQAHFPAPVDIHRNSELSVKLIDSIDAFHLLYKLSEALRSGREALVEQYCCPSCK